MKTVFSQTRHATSLPQNTRIMKRLALFLVLLSATPLWAQLVEQPPYTNADIPQYVQYLNLTDSFPNLQFYIHGEYSTIVFEQDTVDYVSMRLNSWDDTNHVQAWINLDPVSPSMSIYVRGQDVVQIHSRHKDLRFYAHNSNHIYIHSSCDSVLHYDNIIISAYDHCIVEFINPIVANTVMLDADDYATIRYSRYTCKSYREHTYKYGSIEGLIRNGENVGKHWESGHVETNFPQSPHTTQKIHYSASDRFHINLYGGLNTIAPNILYGPLEAPAKISLGNFQTEATYDFVARDHFTFGFGLGYCYNNYIFHDPYVRFPFEEWYNSGGNFLSLTPEEIPFGEEQYWRSDLTVQQLVLPIHFAYYRNSDHSKGFHAEADLVPSIFYGKAFVHQRYGEFLGTGIDEYNNNTPYEEFLNYSHYDQFIRRLQCDLRLSVGWGSWNIYAQYALNEYLFVGSGHELSLGFKLSL